MAITLATEQRTVKRLLTSARLCRWPWNKRGHPWPRDPSLPTPSVHSWMIWRVTWQTN